MLGGKNSKWPYKASTRPSRNWFFPQKSIKYIQRQAGTDRWSFTSTILTSSASWSCSRSGFTSPIIIHIPPPPLRGSFEPFEPPPSRSDHSFGNFNIRVQQPSSFNNQKFSGNLFGSQTQTLISEKEKVVKDNIQKKIGWYNLWIPRSPKTWIRWWFVEHFEADILDQEFVNKKQQEGEVLEQIKEEYNFDKIKDAFDEGTVPQQLDFFYGCENCIFNRAVELLSLSNENREFIAFLLSDLGQNLMTNNSLSIHIENGDIFYQNFNTGENFYTGWHKKNSHHLNLNNFWNN